MRVPFCMFSLILRKESKHFQIDRFDPNWTLQTCAQNLKYWLAQNAIETNKILKINEVMVQLLMELLLLLQEYQHLFSSTPRL